MTQLTRCILTGHRLTPPIEFDETEESIIQYRHPATGQVRIMSPLLMEYMDSGQYDYSILAGICRNEFEAGREAPLLSADFVENIAKEFNPLKGFKSKARHFLKYLYNKGGNEYEEFTLFASVAYPICFAEDSKEFNRILDYLNKNRWIEWKASDALGGGQMHYRGLQLTESGIDEVEKELPKIPMIGLVSQDITTGDPDVDEQINHARDLFFQLPQTFERMRSACEQLSFVLEPLRKDLEKHFASRDVSDFFNIVNNFDIRHNKETTKSLSHPEQLEWVFYTLLNTINTYTKLRDRLSS